MNQTQGKIQTAWQDVISEAKVTPKMLEKQAFQRLLGRACMPALCWDTHAERQKTTDNAAYSKKAFQKQGAIQIAQEGVISGTQLTPKRAKKERMQRPKERAELPALQWRKNAERKPTKDDAAYRTKACQKQGAIQTA